jgi:hypothetical protein
VIVSNQVASTEPDDALAPQEPSDVDVARRAFVGIALAAAFPLMAADKSSKTVSIGTAKYTWLIFSNAKPGREREYNKWYNEVHLPELLKIRGIVSAQRFKLADWQYGDREPPATPTDEAADPFRYMVLLEVEVDDLPEFFRVNWVIDSSGKLTATDAICAEYRAICLTPITPRIAHA